MPRQPTKEEATQGYTEAKKRKDDAEASISSNNKNRGKLESQKSSAQNTLNDNQSQKTNFEKRLRDVEEILAMLTGTAWLNNIVDKISSANKAVGRVGGDFVSAVKCTDIGPADFSGLFRVKSVEEDSNSNSALGDFRRERNDIEQAIVTIKNNISTAESLISTLSKGISGCDNTALNTQARNAQSDMDYYRKFM